MKSIFKFPNRPSGPTEKELDQWVDNAPSGERSNRITAKRSIEYFMKSKKPLIGMRDLHEDISLAKEGTLNLSYLDLSSLPPRLNKIDGIETLVLTGNKLTSIPALGLMPQRLTSLKLSNNDLREIDPNIADLTHLALLDVSSNPLSSFPEGILTRREKTIDAIEASGPRYSDREQIGKWYDEYNKPLVVYANNTMIPPAEIKHLEELAWLNKCSFISDNQVSKEIAPRTEVPVPKESFKEESVQKPSNKFHAKKSLNKNYSDKPLDQFWAAFSKTEICQNYDEEMSGYINRIVECSNKSKLIKGWCENVIEENSFAPVFFQMLFVSQLPDKTVEKMSAKELVEFVKQQMLFEVLLESAKDEVCRNRKVAGSIDEFLTYFSYFYAGKEVGVNLSLDDKIPYEKGPGSYVKYTEPAMKTLKSIAGKNKFERVAEYICEKQGYDLHPIMEQAQENVNVYNLGPELKLDYLYAEVAKLLREEISKEEDEVRKVEGVPSLRPSLRVDSNQKKETDCCIIV